jgi:hypothetical protein
MFLGGDNKEDKNETLVSLDFNLRNSFFGILHTPDFLQDPIPNLFPYELPGCHRHSDPSGLDPHLLAFVQVFSQ